MNSKFQTPDCGKNSDSGIDSPEKSQPRQQNQKKTSFEEIVEILSRPTFLERCQAAKTLSQELPLANICEHITQEKCDYYRRTPNFDRENQDNLMHMLRRSTDCTDQHFKAVFTNSTQASLGQCSFLNLCHRHQTGECRYIHYEEIERDPRFKEHKSIDVDGKAPKKSIEAKSNCSEDDVNITCCMKNQMVSTVVLLLE